MNSWKLQQAIYTKLYQQVSDGDGINASVYDDVPEGAAHPYIVIGEETTSDNGTKDKDGMEHTLTLHTWSQYRGRKQIKELMQSVYDLLHNTDITISGATVANVRQEFSTTLSENDGLTRHGVQRFRVVVFDN